jgi:HlyD family secretion protein
MKKTLIAIILLITGITGYGYLTYGRSEFIPEIRTTTVTQGDIVNTVGATGTLEAVTTVNVGSQVSGMIETLSVDFNSIVRAGDVIMRLDPSLFETQVAQARANLIRAEADTERLRVSLDDARVQLNRAENLAAKQLISETEREAAQLAVRSTEAQVRSSEAAITQAMASLNQNEVNLEHTIIRAPIDGIVISRLVDVGQTVAASLQAPELFVIAADLRKMRVIANIDESDVGRIRPNQRVTFSVDAFPEEEFEGTVSQIRLDPVITQNVVTYATVVDAPNPDLRLKPGMTATITLETARGENVLRIPNAALRFRPTNEMFAVLEQPIPESMQAKGSTDENTEAAPGEDDGRDGGGGSFSTARGDGAPDPERRQQLQARLAQMTPDERERFQTRRGSADGGGRGGGARRPRGAQRAANASSGPNIPTVERGATTIDALFGPLPVTETTGRVWVVKDGRLEEVNVRLGVTDGSATEFLGERGPESDLGAGTTLVTNITTPSNGPLSSRATGRSPLIPQFGQRRR